MRSIVSCAASVAGLLLTGIALAAGPVNPPKSSCAIDEVYKCEKIGSQTFCRCVKRDLSDAPRPDSEPRRLKGKPQHLVNQGAGATDGKPADQPRR